MRDIHCKNCKKLIASLAASVMVATATLVPLRGLLSTAHALPSVPFIQMNNPAVIDMTTAAGVNGIDLLFTYECAPSGVNTAGTINVTSVTQSNTQSGSGQAVPTSNPTSVSIRCDSKVRQVAVTITTPLNVAPYYNAGLATVSATLTDPASNTTSLSSVTVNVIL